MLTRVVTLIALVLGLVLVAAMLALPDPPATLAAPTLAAAPASGVPHPVTAVLLAFRAYDTLLEVAVVLLAVRIAAPTLEGPMPTMSTMPTLQTTSDTDPIAAALLRVLVPLIAVIAGVLLWAGTTQPGGAFAAGALAAGAGVALRLGGQWTAPLTDWRWRVMQVAGIGVFIVLGTLPLFMGRPWLSTPSGWAAAIVLAIEAAVTVSIAAGLVSLFSSPPAGAVRTPTR
jgi:multisubunit Na+/H+ antiporter MnhB subunit